MVSDSASWTGEQVPERVVIDYWLAAETRKRTVAVPGTGAVDDHEDHDDHGDQSESAFDDRPENTLDDRGVGALDDDEALDALLQRKPGAAAFLWRAQPVEWARITLRRAEFERLQFVDGPDRLGWRALAPSGDLVDGARRIAAGDRAALEAETGVDVERVCSMAETLADGDRLGPLVLTKRRGSGPPSIADGNHRATAIALHLVRTGEYRPQRAYLGIGANPVLEPLWQRVRGALTGLRSDGTRW
ncbi:MULTISPECIES: hypothetical protein [Halococcus]|uniref:hypothetical protein n=1 Tax=Halococcus TaxID=2249 RepID=UPI0006777CEB|nr:MULTISPECIES: hypothetical protein [Halococcus]